MNLSRHWNTGIPSREVQGFYMEISSQGNSNHMLWQCTGFEGSNLNEIQGNTGGPRLVRFQLLQSPV